MKLCEKTILITGASSGIGRQVAIDCAKKNNRLILVARRIHLLNQLVVRLDSSPLGHLVFPCDVTDFDQVKDLCEWLVQAEISIDVLFLNAGISTGFDVKNFDTHLFTKSMEVNFFGAVYFLQFLLPQMIERKSGVIAVNGSLAGYRGMPHAAPYSASKGALMNMVESLRIDLLKYNIQCTLISSGFVTTPLTDKNDFIMPLKMPVEKASKIIIRGLERQKTEICFPWLMSFLAHISRFIPNKIYAALMQSRRKKRRKAKKSRKQSD